MLVYNPHNLLATYHPCKLPLSPSPYGSEMRGRYASGKYDQWVHNIGTGRFMSTSWLWNQDGIWWCEGPLALQHAVDLLT